MRLTMRKKFSGVEPRNTPELINLNVLQNELPFIYIPEINANFLLDTGSMRNIINPNLANKFYKIFIRNEIFHIQSAHNIRFHDEVAIIPVSKIFGVNEYHKMYLFDFTPKYDGWLISVDLLKQLNAVIDINQKLLITSIVTLPIIYDKKTH